MNWVDRMQEQLDDANRAPRPRVPIWWVACAGVATALVIFGLLELVF